MRIDVHGHVSAPAELGAYRSVLLASRGSHGRGMVDRQLDGEKIKAFFDAGGAGGPASGKSHLQHMDDLGTDVQLISPRPFQLMHSEKPPKIVQWWAEVNNNVIYTQTQVYPERFVGIAGLPQIAGESVELACAELERCVKDLKFRGALVNPDPYENGPEEPPPMYDRYWYPLYEKFVELGVVMYIHSCSSRSERAPYSMNFVAEETIAVLNLVNSPVFQDFPDLKVVVSHGGGAIPYQVGRFEAGSVRRDANNRFTKRMRNIYYDTCLYSQEAIELLVKVVGADRCLFGSECPGTGTSIDPDDGHQYDDVASYILDIEWLSQDEKEQILYKNALELFGLTVKPRL